MSLLAWLTTRAPDIDTPPPPRFTAINVDLGGLTEAEDNEIAPDSDPIDVYELDEMLCMIDYCSASGETSRRRITLRKIARGPHAPILSAICHERRAFRQFRCDRIECFIEPDGEVVSCKDFFRDRVLVDLDLFAPNSATLAIPLARQIRDTLRAPLSLLVTAAHSDGEFHPEELDAICQYIEAEIFSSERCANLSGDVTIEVLDQMTDLVRHMRPQRESIDGYLRKVLDFAPEDVMRFSRALEHVVVADGRFHRDERDFLEELASFTAAHDATVRRRIAGVL
jgi:tellurite resistance protein